MPVGSSCRPQLGRGLGGLTELDNRLTGQQPCPLEAEQGRAAPGRLAQAADNSAGDAAELDGLRAESGRAATAIPRGPGRPRPGWSRLEADGTWPGGSADLERGPRPGAVRSGGAAGRGSPGRERSRQGGERLEVGASPSCSSAGPGPLAAGPLTPNRSEGGSCSRQEPWPECGTTRPIRGSASPAHRRATANARDVSGAAFSSRSWRGPGRCAVSGQRLRGRPHVDPV
jgi:hypothetical protein